MSVVTNAILHYGSYGRTSLLASTSSSRLGQDLSP
jgi:hypothetical protein